MRRESSRNAGAGSFCTAIFGASACGAVTTTSSLRTSGAAFDDTPLNSTTGANPCPTKAARPPRSHSAPGQSTTTQLREPSGPPVRRCAACERAPSSTLNPLARNASGLAAVEPLAESPLANSVGLVQSDHSCSPAQRSKHSLPSHSKNLPLSAR